MVDGGGAEHRTTPRSERWFAIALACVVLAALAIRVVYVLTSRDGISFAGDSAFYHDGANLLARGKGFIYPQTVGGLQVLSHKGQVVQEADHPPLYIIFLAVPSLLGMTSVLTQLLWSCVLGAGTVLIVGLLGRAVLNARVGLLAAALAATYPNMWIPDGSLQAETAAMFTTALTLLLGYHYLKRPSLQRLVAVGAAAGAASLARSELLLLVPFVVLPLALLTDVLSFRRQMLWLASAALATLLVIGPWIGYNLARFRHPVFLSDQYQSLLASANCDTTYYGRLIGYFSITCAAQAATHYHAAGDQSQVALAYQQGAAHYVRGHLGRVPVVVAARLGRTLEVFRPSQGLALRELFDEVEKPVATAALYSYYLLALLAIAGALLLRRRRRPVFLLLAPIIIVVITVAVTYSNTRFRAPAEVALTVLAAVSIDTAWTRLAQRSHKSHQLDTASRASDAPGSAERGQV